MTDGCEGFAHVAVCHRSTEELLASAAPFVREGLAMDERVLINLAAERAGALHAALGDDADRVQWSDSDKWHPRPPHRLRAIQDLVGGETCGGHPRLRILGECAWPGPGTSSPPAREMTREWERFEAVLNVVLAGAPLTLLCTYDAAALSPGVVDGAACTHPVLWTDRPVRSPSYVDPVTYLAASQPWGLSAPREASWALGRVTPAEARAHVRRGLARSGTVSPEIVEDMLVAATEVVTNSWRAGAGSIAVACWHRGAEVGVQVEDDGPGIDDPLAGYRRPWAGSDGGRGLWIVRQLAELVEIAPGPGSKGASVRMRTWDREA